MSSTPQVTTTLTISNDKTKDIIEIVESLEDSGLLFRGVSETIQNEAKKQKGGFLSILLRTLGASFVGNLWAGKGVMAKRQGRGINRAREGIVRAGYGNEKGQKITTKRYYYENECIFNATSSFDLFRNTKTLSEWTSI